MEAGLRDRPFRAMSGVSSCSPDAVDGDRPLVALTMAGQTERLACAIWTDGQKWGITVLGEEKGREQHFRCSVGQILVEVDAIDQQFDITRPSFAARGETVHRSIQNFKDAHNLKLGDRVWLRIVEPYRVFRLETE
jgi:hypothetical protein